MRIRALGSLGEGEVPYDFYSDTQGQVDAYNMMIASGWSPDDAYNYLYGGTPDAAQITVYGSSGSTAPTSAGTDYLNRLLNSITSGGQWGGANVKYVPVNYTPGALPIQSSISKMMPFLLLGGVALFAMANS